MARVTSGQLQVLGPEGWERVVGLEQVEVVIVEARPLAVQIEAEHWCGDDPELQPEPVRLGAMLFCSGCGAWLDHPEGAS